jgi:nucleoside-diphosphate-sugar epimerase
VVEELQSRGYTPVIFDHHRRLAQEYPNEVEVFQGDIMDQIAVTEAMAHVDGWIHLAAVLGTQETIMNPRPAAQSNLMGGLNILEAAAQYDLPGSYIAVGNHWMNNTYSITKTMIERFIDMFNKYRNTKVNIVRAVNAYGPRQLAVAPFGPGKVRKITPSFVCRALTHMDVEVYGDGSQISDMVYVADVAKALVNAMAKAHMGEVFDVPVEVGPEVNSTVQEVAELIIAISGSQSKIVNLPMRPGEIPGAVVKADTSTLKLVDMDPKDLVGLPVGMQLTVDYFKEYLNETGARKLDS